ncbi:M17 family peptidase N-terminal domain-containing protein, partial [Roseateles sp. GG27B]
MDFRTQSTAFDALAALPSDALILVIAGEALPAEFDADLAELINDAVKLGDFELKAGKTLTLQRPQGVKAPRLVLAAAGKPSLKAARAALLHAFAQLKGRGVAHAAVAFVGFDAMTTGLAEQFVLAASEAVYVYRQTKPSAPTPSKLVKVTLLLDKADAGAAKVAKVGVALGQAIAAGIELARECGNLPGNYATPTYLGEQAKALGLSHGLKVEVMDKKAVEKLGMGSFLS